MPTDLTAEIAARRKKAADLRRQADLLDAEARGMELASAHMASAATATDAPPPIQSSPGMVFHITPPCDTPVTTGEPRGHPGRQKGAISKTWRLILGELYKHFPNGFGEIEVCRAAQLHGLETLRPKDARERMKSYANTGLTEIDGDRFRVSRTAIKKFELDEMAS